MAVVAAIRVHRPSRSRRIRTVISGFAIRSASDMIVGIMWFTTRTAVSCFLLLDCELQHLNPKP